jgi:hypothetical protein
MEKTNVSMMKIKQVCLNHQLWRLNYELRKDVINENMVNFIRKDIQKLEHDINEFKKLKNN